MGTLGVLGLELVQMDTAPTTAYLQIYTEKRCRANCLFCAQAQGSQADITHIARGMYVPVDLDEVVKRLCMAFEKGYLLRACIQTELYDEWWEDTLYLIKSIRKVSDIPISLSVFPLSDKHYRELKIVGVNEVVIPLDACTPPLFDKIKGKSAGGPYSWEKHIDGIRRAAVFFEKVGTHLIIGLGETDEEAVWIIDLLKKINANPALFSYTYVNGTQLEIPERNETISIKHYRTVQLARYLITEGIANFSDMRFVDGVLCDFGASKEAILEIIEDGCAFQTTGCSECNRPMANETFCRIFNFPRRPDNKEIIGIKKELACIQP
ncbi:MAG: radical SAM protein [Candidatus Methanoperedens sp.]|nr:radical SAM protein [Candidatus Methanoperedens sp.]MCE8425650.1 radical SAM protein [Candidatus Methanoperedens sp.]MCE8428479.1 radical SAM protein [Candidatus Methanoperedens sp.]